MVDYSALEERRAKMADTSSKKSLFRILALVGVLVLLAGAVMFLLANRSANLAETTVAGSTQNPDDYTWPVTAPGGQMSIQGTGQPGTTVSISDADGNTLCGKRPVSDAGTWTCDATLNAGDYSLTVGTDVFSLPIGVAGLVIAMVGAAMAIAGGLGLVVVGGKPIGLLSLLLIPVGVALDFAFSALNQALKLPLFLDSVGHILAGMLGGPVIGGITGFLGVLTNATFQPAAVVWSFQGATIGIVVGLLAQAGMFKNWRRAIVSALIVILTSATMSSIISLVIFGGIDGYMISFLRVALMNGLGWSKTSAVVATSVVIELVDKTISVGLPFLVITAMSNRLLNQFITGPKLRELKTETAEEADAEAGIADATAELRDGGYGPYGDK